MFLYIFSSLFSQGSVSWDVRICLLLPRILKNLPDAYRHSFCCTSFSRASQILHFLQVQDLGQRWIEQVCWHHFSNIICLLNVSLSHFDISFNIWNFFITIVYYGNLWSVMFDLAVVIVPCTMNYIHIRQQRVNVMCGLVHGPAVP